MLCVRMLVYSVYVNTGALWFTECTVSTQTVPLNTWWRVMHAYQQAVSLSALFSLNVLDTHQLLSSGCFFNNHF